MKKVVVLTTVFAIFISLCICSISDRAETVPIGSDSIKQITIAETVPIGSDSLSAIS